MFYTYLHVRDDTHKVFYVGKGHGKRAFIKYGRTKQWKRIVTKAGYKVEIAAFFETESQAFDHEKFLIAKYRTDGHLLLNVAEGGQGASGYKQRPEVVARRAATLATPEVQAKILSAIPRGEHHHASRRVTCVETGITFESLSAARDWLISIGFEKASQVAIGHACRGRFQKIYKHHWKFADVEFLKPKYIDRRPKRAVTCVEAGLTFASIRLALAWLKENGVEKPSSTSISAACSGRRPRAYGRHWQYVPLMEPRR